MKNTLITFLFILFISGCKKDDNQPVTILPGSYFPVYPGSYWVYLENNSRTYTDSTSDHYMEHQYYMGEAQKEDGSTYKRYSETVLVPFLNGNPIYKYQKLVHYIPPYGDTYGLDTFLSEKIGDKFSEWADTRYGDFTEHNEVVAKTTNENNDSVLIVNGHWVYGPNVGSTNVKTYVKNVGLTSKYLINLDGDTTYKLELTDYFVNLP
jgi:hypothetical protein